MMKNEILLIRFINAEGNEEVTQGDIYQFDNKPFIVKAWTSKMNFSK